MAQERNHNANVLRERILADVYHHTLSVRIHAVLEEEDGGLSSREIAGRITDLWGLAVASEDIATFLQKRRIHCRPGMCIVKKKQQTRGRGANTTSTTLYRLVMDPGLTRVDREAIKFSKELHVNGQAPTASRDVMSLFATKYLTRGEVVNVTGGTVSMHHKNSVRILVGDTMGPVAEELFYERLNEEAAKMRDRGGRYATWIICAVYEEDKQWKRIQEACDITKLADARNVHFVRGREMVQEVIRYLDVMYHGPTMDIIRADNRQWEVLNPDASVSA